MNQLKAPHLLQFQIVLFTPKWGEGSSPWIITMKWTEMALVVFSTANQFHRRHLSISYGTNSRIARCQKRTMEQQKGDNSLLVSALVCNPKAKNPNLKCETIIWQFFLCLFLARYTIKCYVIPREIIRKNTSIRSNTNIFSIIPFFFLK